MSIATYSVLSYKGKTPDIAPSVFLAAGVRIIGNVGIADESSCWYNAVIRGDVNVVRIGSRTNIQDNAVLHVSHDTQELRIGNQVTAGHGCILHSCTIEDCCLIGMGACVLDGATIRTCAFVGAGALVPSGMEIPSGTLAVGVPARVVRDLTEEEIANMERSAQHYYELAEEQKL